MLFSICVESVWIETVVLFFAKKKTLIGLSMVIDIQNTFDKINSIPGGRIIDSNSLARKIGSKCKVQEGRSLFRSHTVIKPG